MHSKIVVSAKEKKYIQQRRSYEMFGQSVETSAPVAREYHRQDDYQWRVGRKALADKFRGSRAGETARRSSWLEEREHSQQRTRPALAITLQTVRSQWTLWTLSWDGRPLESRTKESHCLIHLLTTYTLLVCWISRGFLGELGKKWVY